MRWLLATFTKNGPEKVEDGQPTLQALSKAVWQAETGKTIDEYDKQQKEKNKPKPPDPKPNEKDKDPGSDGPKDL